MAAIAVQMGRKYAAIIDIALAGCGFKDNGTSAIAEQNAGRAVVPVKQA